MKILFVLAISLLHFFNGWSQTINLAAHQAQNKMQVINRELSKYDRDAVTMNAAEGDGLAILTDASFEIGTIQLEIKGENAQGKSFVGFAFNIQNDSTYEAVYFRPFNFVAEEPVRKSHMMQYIYHPKYPWYTLREERTDEFEAELPAPPNPDGWFKVKIEVGNETVSVFLEGEPTAVLTVDRLSTSLTSTIGLWVGHRSSGWFRNLTISGN